MGPNRGILQMSRLKVSFRNKDGLELAGMLELPEKNVTAYALFAHCFTCTKDITAASRINRALAARQIGVLRFDFTGLGNSDGDFENTNFSSNVEDLVSAADFLRKEYQAPALLIGHSLGGAAVLRAAREVPEAAGVVTIGAPADPKHVVKQFQYQLESIQKHGVGDVMLAGRKFTIKKQFLDDISSQNLHDAVRNLAKALLVFHSPTDEVVSIGEAASIFQAAKHPKSFVSLDTADHLLTKASDAEYVAAVIASWAGRFLH